MSGETAAGLRRDAIGLREVLFRSVTAMAAAAGVAASLPSGAAFAGGSLPLSVLIALVACPFTASSVAEWARHLAAGSVPRRGQLDDLQRQRVRRRLDPDGLRAGPHPRPAPRPHCWAWGSGTTR